MTFLVYIRCLITPSVIKLDCGIIFSLKNVISSQFVALKTFTSSLVFSSWLNVGPMPCRTCSILRQGNALFSRYLDLCFIDKSRIF